MESQRCWSVKNTSTFGGRRLVCARRIPVLNAAARHYLAGSDASAPLASPIHGDFRGLPPTLIQCGTDELLHDQSVRLHDALRKAGVVARCEIMRERWHVFQIHAGLLPGAKAAIERAGNFIRRKIPA